MKKIVSLSWLLLLLGCSEETIDVGVNKEKNEYSQNEVNVQSISEEEVVIKQEIMSGDSIVYPNEIINSGAIEMYDSSYLLDTVMEDLTGDGKEEEITLYISPSPFDEETGEAIHWDHSHFWHLIVRDGDKTYPLFNSHTTGKLQHWIVQNPEKPLILVEESGAGIVIYKFKYVEGAFEKQVLVDTGVTFKRSMVEW